MLCYNCFKYYEYMDNLCSFCYGEKNNTDYYRSYIKKLDLTDNDVIQFYNTGIHSINKSGKELCVACQEPNITYSKFNCNCYPMLCNICLKKVNRCPYCNENSFFKLSENDIKHILFNNFNIEIFNEILLKIIKKNNIKGNISIKNLICTSSIVTKIYEELDKLLEFDHWHQNNIYSFAIDLWNIPPALNNKNNVAHCYKGGVLNYISKSYNYFNKYRFNCANPLFTSPTLSYNIE